MKRVRPIELLAPAKNAEVGIEAIRHGADAVYIGAPAFSARSAAGNSLDEIRRLVAFAHPYRAKVYVALNTLLKDHELDEVQQLITDLYRTGVDALIIQDMGILQMQLPPIAIHASTQCDNRTLEKVEFLEKAGFAQAVLARELTLDEIKEIAAHTTIPLEVFVHGALCTSYSGQCYISQALSGRSANRGNCAQYCRLPYTLRDANGKTIVANRHLLSLKDLNQSAHLETLLDAGVSSLKIEGRLKEMSYVKNVTAYYRQQLDELFARRPEYVAASSGKTTHFFLPDPAKSFNRDFTNYFLWGRKGKIASPETPKSLGETIGAVKDLSANYFTINGSKTIHNGDGLCFINEGKTLQGFRVNKVEGLRIHPAEMPRLHPGTVLYRNYDHEFERLLSKPSAERKIALQLTLSENAFGFTLTAVDSDGCSVSVMEAFTKELSRKDQQANIREQLSRLGNTLFRMDELIIDLSANWFIPSSLLGTMRRRVVESLLRMRKVTLPTAQPLRPTHHPYPETALTYRANVSNCLAKAFYRQHGVQTIAPAFEMLAPADATLMFSRYCIKYQLGYCSKAKPSDKPLPTEPWTLSTGNHHLQLRFDCRLCQMEISAEL